MSELGRVMRLDGAQAASRLEEALSREAPRCARCGNEKIYRIGGRRLRCSSCRYSFRPFTGRWLGRHRIPATAWLAAIKAFELGLGAMELAQVSGLSLPTASDLRRTLQMSLAALEPEWAALIEASKAGQPVPNSFRIVREGGKVKVRIDGHLPQPRVEVLLGEGSEQAARVFRLGLRRWLRLEPLELALVLKEWELRVNKVALFDLAVDALARYEAGPVEEEVEA